MTRRFNRILFFVVLPLAVLFVAIQALTRILDPVEPIQAAFLQEPSEENLLPDAPQRLADPERGLMEFVPSVEETRDEATGFFHPGIGLRKIQLDTMQRRVRAGDEPWADAFELFRKNPDARPGLDLAGLLPADESDSALRLWRAADASYRQIVMWFITGDERCREAALRLLRAWSAAPNSMESADDGLFLSDAVFKFCFVAELLKSAQGQTGATAWTPEDDDLFLRFLCAMRPCFDHVDRTPHEHALGVNAALAVAIFTNDKELFDAAVERFSVNAKGSNDAQNGALTKQFPVVRANALSGRTLSSPHLQVVAMALEPDAPTRLIEAYSAAAAMLQAQETRLDPKTGVPTKQWGAPDVLEFAGRRLLSAANLWADYNSGKDVRYTPCLADQRTKTLNLWIANEEMRGAPAPVFGILYNSLVAKDDYKFEQKRVFPLIRMYESCMPEPDSPFGFGSATLLFTPNKTILDPPRKRFSLTEGLGPNRQPRRNLSGMIPRAGSARAMRENPGEPPFVRVFSAMEATVMAVRGHGFPKEKEKTVSLRLRSDGEATLYIENRLENDRRKRRRIRIPDTGGEWMWFDFELAGGDEAVNEMAFYTIFGTFSKCDLQEIDLDPQDPLVIERMTMQPRHYTRKAKNGDRTIFLFPDIPYVIRFFTNRPIRKAGVHGLRRKIENAGFREFDFNPETLELKIVATPENVNERQYVQVNLYDDAGRVTTQLFTFQIVKDPRALAYEIVENWLPSAPYLPECERRFVDAYFGLLNTPMESRDLGHAASELIRADESLVPARISGQPPAVWLRCEPDEKRDDATLLSVRGAEVADWPLVPGVRNKGKALRNDGSLYLNLHHAAGNVSESNPTGAFAISCFLKLPGKLLRDVQPLFSTQSEEGAPGWRIESFSDHALVLTTDAPRRTIRIPIERKKFFPAGKWVHLFLVVNPSDGSFRVWRNLQKIETRSDAPVAPFDCGDSFVYGANFLDTPFSPSQFDLDEMKIWRALPSEDDLSNIRGLILEKIVRPEKIRLEESDSKTDAPLLVSPDRANAASIDSKGRMKTEEQPKSPAGDDDLEIFGAAAESED